MSQGYLSIVQNMYEAFAQGNVQVMLDRMNENIVWYEAENFLYADGNPYIGPDAVVKGVFARIGPDWDNFWMAIAEFIDAGDTVIVHGRYKGNSTQNGEPLDAQFAHVWKFENEKAIRFQQYTDTAQFAKLFSSTPTKGS